MRFASVQLTPATLWSRTGATAAASAKRLPWRGELPVTHRPFVVGSRNDAVMTRPNANPAGPPKKLYRLGTVSDAMRRDRIAWAANKALHRTAARAILSGRR